MTSIDDIGYGRQFDGWYDRLFPKDGLADRTAKQLASLHPDPVLGTLELGVGTGRIAIPLSRVTGRVVGVDSSPEMLSALEKDVAATSADVEGVRGDIRFYTDDRQYGLVYCVCGTLSMLLDPADQQRAVSRAAERLAPGGVLVVETHNKPGVLALHAGQQRMTYFVPYPSPGTGLQTHSTLVPEQDLWQCSHIWFESDGTSRVGTELSRLTTPEEVDAYATAAGLTPVARHADWDSSPYTPQGPMFVSVYTKDA
ncbi:class I SAM-dependent methyltransferase [Streptomyces sp. ALI-76-A]|jgi:SAM-dependent methyltransferase|uniref:class I SAM-dependent methyltransferase n=1 Tax=Streptomyces sp. ALI-76-A TaxID=3025736 RepID=UPI00256F6050|nr:class I SAM-dependent methyltransferase [Streptomyces sp. ALI-76-A]MDL5206017.1 class I SAM-dependent methyltransferase [Streptomyces sp. ALI-76-A]